MIFNKENLKEAFVKADTSGSGKLNFQQIQEVLSIFAPEDENKGTPEFELMTDFIFSMADLNHDNMLNWEELSLYFFEFHDMDKKETARVMFKIADTNVDGFVTKKELKKFLELIAVADVDETPDDGKINEMIATYDKDADGKLNFEEFNQALDEGLY